MRVPTETASPDLPLKKASLAVVAGYRTFQQKQSGFTLIELIIVTVIFGIVAAMAMPGFQVFVAGSRISATTNNFVSSLYAARSEAITRGERAGLCPSFNSTDPNAQCAPGASWTDGWIVFVDDDANGVRTVGGAAEDMIVQQEAMTAGFSVAVDAPQFQDRIYFAVNGTSITMAGVPISGTVTLQYGDEDARAIRIAANGRVSSSVVP